MNKFLTLIALSLSLSACGLSPLEEPLSGENFIHPDLQPYYDAYQASAKISNKVLPVPKYLSLDFNTELNTSGAVGLCRLSVSTSGAFAGRVTILKSYWDRVSEVNKRILIFHELTHCILKRGHSTGTLTLDNGREVPQSIMNPYTIGSYFYGMIDTLLEMMPYYEDELFNPAASRSLENIQARSKMDVTDPSTNETHTHSTYEFTTNQDLSCSQ